MKQSLWRTLLSGLLVVLPAMIFVMVLVGVALWLRKTLQSMASVLSLAVPFHGPWAVAWAMLALLLASLAIGLLLYLPMMQNLVASANRSLTRRLPLYGHFRGFEAGYLGRTGQKRIQAALVELDETFAPAFVAEELPDGRYVMYVPLVPTVREGAIYVMPRERVHLIDASATQVIHSIHHWGVGTGELLKTLRKS